MKWNHFNVIAHRGDAFFRQAMCVFFYYKIRIQVKEFNFDVNLLVKAQNGKG